MTELQQAPWETKTLEDLKRDANRRAQVVTREFPEWRVELCMNNVTLISDLMPKCRAMDFKRKLIKEYPGLSKAVTIQLDFSMARLNSIKMRKRDR